MTHDEFSSLIKTNRCQVFLFSSPCSLPISLFRHTWLVTNNFGQIHRFEIWSYKKRCTKEKGHLTVDFHPPTFGLTIWPNARRDYGCPRYHSRLAGSVEGGPGSLVQSMVEFIEKKHLEYPNKFVYRYFPGPNSNTFVKWILNHFPGCGLKLPWNAI